MGKRKRRGTVEQQNEEIKENVAEKKDINSATVEKIPKKIRTDHLLPKNLQKMNLLLNPDMANERKGKEEEAKEKFNDQFGGMDLQKSYRNLFPILWYSQLPCFDVKNITSNTPGEMSIIKKCFWKEMEMSCPSIFTTMPTDRGMCCIFNMKKAEEIFQKSEYASLIQTMQSLDFENR